MMRNLVATLGLMAGMVWGGSAVADGHSIVVELFTSQGCSSCPPADAMLEELAARDDVIALAFHVDYWDYIGWTDTFGSAQNTARQHAYARAAGVRSVYTPQFVVGGVDHVIGARGMELADAISAHRTADVGVTLTASMTDGRLSVQASAATVAAMTIQLVRYSLHETVDIARGENAGETIAYTNIVMAWDVMTEWDGSRAIELAADLSGSFPSVVIVQEAGAGAILAAVAVP